MCRLHANYFLAAVVMTLDKCSTRKENVYKDENTTFIANTIVNVINVRTVYFCISVQTDSCVLFCTTVAFSFNILPYKHANF